MALGYKPQQASQIVTKVAVEGCRSRPSSRESLRSLVSVTMNRADHPRRARCEGDAAREVAHD